MSSNPHIEKPKLSEEQLRCHNIYFFPEVCDADDMCETIKMTAQVLQFRGRISKTTRKELRKELQEYLTTVDEHADMSGWSLGPPELGTDAFYNSKKRFAIAEDSEEMKVTLARCEDVRDDAIKRREKNSAEVEWVKLLRDDVFQSFEDTHRDANHNQIMHSRWELHHDLHWNEFSKWENTNPAVNRRTGPKPDFTLAFPIIDTTQEPASQCVYLVDEQVQAFSSQVLRQLRCDENVKLRSAPTTSFHKHKEAGYQLGAEHLTCFPWAVVEVKRSHPKEAHNTAAESFCYCQAANASASALFLREELAKKAGVTSPTQDALVIFAFTCVGPNVKLWVTYRNPEDNDVKMICIWASSLELTWGVLVLHMIFENVREYIFAKAKPQIGQWIRQVRNKSLLPIIHTPEGDVVPQRQRSASCVPPTPTTKRASPRTPARPAARVHSGKSAPAKISQFLDVPGQSRSPRTPSYREKYDAHFSNDSGCDMPASEDDYAPSSSSDTESDDDSDSGTEYVRKAVSPKEARRLERLQTRYPDVGRGGDNDKRGGATRRHGRISYGGTGSYDVADSEDEACLSDGRRFGALETRTIKTTRKTKTKTGQSLAVEDPVTAKGPKARRRSSRF